MPVSERQCICKASIPGEEGLGKPGLKHMNVLSGVLFAHHWNGILAL